MDQIPATVRDGQIVLDAPVDWPDGTRIFVVPCDERIGIAESQWPTTESGIQAMLDRMETTKSLEFTVEEHGEVEEARRETRSTERAMSEQNADELEQLF